jgi:two-component system response regulator FixJ
LARETIWKALQLDAARRRRALPKPEEPWRRLKSLNDDERQVLQMTVEGKPNKAIAKRLGIGLRTVHVRRAEIMKKLNVSSRAELVQLAVAADLQAGGQAISPLRHDGREATMASLVR